MTKNEIESLVKEAIKNKQRLDLVVHQEGHDEGEEIYFEPYEFSAGEREFVSGKISSKNGMDARIFIDDIYCAELLNDDD